MNFYHVRYFVSAVEQKSIQKAAGLNRVTVPALSQSIRSLEHTLGFELLRHQKRIFELTPTGELFFEKAKSWLLQVDQDLETIKSLNGQITGTLKIAGPQSLIQEYLWSKLVLSRKLHPLLRLQMRTGPSRATVDWVRNQDCDLGFMIESGQKLGPEIESRVLDASSFVLVGRPRIKIVAETPFMVTDVEKSEVKSLLKSYKNLSGQKNIEILEILSWSALKKMALNGAGLAWVPEYVVREELSARRLKAYYPQELKVAYRLIALWRRSRREAPRLKSFLKLLSK